MDPKFTFLPSVQRYDTEPHTFIMQIIDKDTSICTEMLH